MLANEPTGTPLLTPIEISFDAAVTGFLCIGETTVELTRCEMAILYCLNKAIKEKYYNIDKDTIVSSERTLHEISLYVWNDPKHSLHLKTFGVHLLNLRKKIKPLGLTVSFNKLTKAYYIAA